MSNPFLIPKIPRSAEYYITPAFVVKHGTDLVEFSNRLQVVDPCPPSKQRGFSPNILAVEDAILQKPTSPILCSTSIFKSHHRHGNEEWWTKYVEDLRLKIEHYASDPNQHLRVYVGNSMWEDLDHAGLLTQNADFIKMCDNSMGWNIGNMWRILAMTDKTYEFVYFEDLHDLPDLEQICNRLTTEVFENTDASIAARIVEPPTRELTFLMNPPNSFYTDISGHFYLPIISMIPIESFLKTKIFDWYIQPQKLCLAGPELEDVILRVLNNKNLFRLYDPELNRWTYMQPHYQIFQEADSAEKIMFYFMRKIKMKLWVLQEHIHWYTNGYKRFGDGFFMKRLLDQITCDLKVGHLGKAEFNWV